jgi:hypothetical protein
LGIHAAGKTAGIGGGRTIEFLALASGPEALRT